MGEVKAEDDSGREQGKANESELEQRGSEYVQRVLMQCTFGDLCFGTYARLTLWMKSRLEITWRTALVGMLSLATTVMTAALPVGTRLLYLRESEGGSGAKDLRAAADQLLLTWGNLEWTLLAVGVVVAAVLPWIVQRLSAPRSSDREKQFDVQLRNAIERMPPVSRAGQGRDSVGQAAVKEAVKDTLLALQSRLGEFVGGGNAEDLQVSLLVFADDSGAKMRVYSRTHDGEHTQRTIARGRLLAWQAAKRGRPLTEHDFKRTSNPYPNIRLSVPGQRTVNYRSMLLLPLLWSDLSVTRSGQNDPTDFVIGVVTVTCKSSYRFWRARDWRFSGAADPFSTRAYEAASLYLALLTKLIQSDASRVRVSG